MQHLFTPYSKVVEPFAWWEGAFTEEQLDWLQQKAKNASTKAQVNKEKTSELDTEVRRAEVLWLTKDLDTSWIFETLSTVILKLNADHFGFDLTGFGEPLQLVNYREEVQGNYSWHRDFGSSGPSRKLSVVLQLSDSNEYEGGQLQLLTKKDPINIPKKRGFITVFPTWTLHQVTPVVRGTRQSLVTWVSGPPFI
tara:strand:+ start:834 stop:1418 length:585 start_codon:yes stop_codon:yes gene_type:complete